MISEGCMVQCTTCYCQNNIILYYITLYNVLPHGKHELSAWTMYVCVRVCVCVCMRICTIIYYTNYQPC